MEVISLIFLLWIPTIKARSIVKIHQVTAGNEASVLISIFITAQYR